MSEILINGFDSISLSAAVSAHGGSAAAAAAAAEGASAAATSSSSGGAPPQQQLHQIMAAMMTNELAFLNFCTLLNINNQVYHYRNCFAIIRTLLIAVTPPKLSLYFFATLNTSMGRCSFWTRFILEIELQIYCNLQINS
jgi:hypothetical protein